MNFLVFLGSVRTSTPPRPARLGERVARYCQRTLSARGHMADLVDPLKISTAPPSAPGTFKPQFAYATGKAPDDLDRLATDIAAADAYVMVSPEYNHSMSPALADLLNHFGSSLFTCKPSAIVTYSAGQWGGARAAVHMRSFLSELGCLPVSAMAHFPKAQEVLDEDGNIHADQDEDSWTGYLSRSLGQLEWWAEAASMQRRRIPPEQMTAPFKSNPAQRNAGGRKA